MKNYEYIVASLPAISTSWKFGEGTSFHTYAEEIKRLGDKADGALVDKLLAGFEDENLDEAFYRGMAEEKNAFLRNYFAFDLNVRNAKTRYLNKALGRPAEQDVIHLGDTPFEEAERLEAVLQEKDLLSRERALDDLMWDKISQLTSFHYFDIAAVLGFLAKLHIIARWAELDEQAGRARFAALVKEVQSTFKGVDYHPEKTE